MNLLQHIAQSRPLLRKSELKVADHVLLDPAAVMHSSMADLAHDVGISEPTIVRFCRAIGCNGFQDLKLKLAQSLAAGASFGQFAIHEDDSVTDFSLKIFDTTLHTLMEVREHLDPQALQRAISACAQAQLEILEAVAADGAAETHDGGLADADVVGEVGHGAVHDGSRIHHDLLGDLELRLAQQVAGLSNVLHEVHRRISSSGRM